MSRKTTSSNELSFPNSKSISPPGSLAPTSLAGPQQLVKHNHSLQAETLAEIVLPDTLRELLDNNENEGIPVSTLKYERELYRELSTCEDIDSLENRIATVLSRLGFAEYSFLRLNAVSGTEALVPTGLLASYRDKAFLCGGLMLRAESDNTRNRHLSALYHFVASAPADLLCQHSGQYVFIVGSSNEGYYLALVGSPSVSRFISMSPLRQKADTQSFRQHIECHQYALDLLAIMIEAVGGSNFPDLFDVDKKEAQVTITPRPLRLLNILAKRDVTLRQAADILCLSPDTINKHVAAAKAALGTTTLPGTLWKAVGEGLIDSAVQ